MKFSKWSGCGNDFIIMMESEAKNVDAATMCDRQNGIGADGVVILRHLKDNDFSMRIINSDNSEAGMCNASRCAAKFIYQSTDIDSGTDTRIEKVGLKEYLSVGN